MKYYCDSIFFFPNKHIKHIYPNIVPSAFLVSEMSISFLLASVFPKDIACSFMLLLFTTDFVLQFFLQGCRDTGFHTEVQALLGIPWLSRQITFRCWTPFPQLTLHYKYLKTKQQPFRNHWRMSRLRKQFSVKFDVFIVLYFYHFQMS